MDQISAEISRIYQPQIGSMKEFCRIKNRTVWGHLDDAAFKILRIGLQGALDLLLAVSGMMKQC
uniref:Uncharacterized protein n=1 Tax=Spironucleus salmonicida TaxID=348837 RepID=V6LLL2_9EUKA|eukprot:EST45570.1 Hypothetical protein SS50377_14500 [Spironucleus salmonicida]